VKNNKSDKNINIIQPARLAKSQNLEMNNLGHSTQHSITNSHENENWITQAGKRNLSSSSSGSTTSISSSTKTTQQKNKKLFFSTRNRYEPLTITEPTDMVFDTVMVSEDPDPDTAVLTKLPSPIFMKGINDLPSF